MVQAMGPESLSWKLSPSTPGPCGLGAPSAGRVLHDSPVASVHKHPRGQREAPTHPTGGTTHPPGL